MQEDIKVRFLNSEIFNVYRIWCWFTRM